MGGAAAAAGANRGTMGLGSNLSNFRQLQTSRIKDILDYDTCMYDACIYPDTHDYNAHMYDAFIHDP